MKIVYAVTTQGHDVYSAMTRVSVASLRYSNPEVRIVLACDNNSCGMLTSVGDPLLSEVDQVISHATPSGEPDYRNRFVKTQLRNVITGPFLFLDSDTLVRGDLAPISKAVQQCDVALAYNRSFSTIDRQLVWAEDIEHLRAMNWEVSATQYMNGGAIFYNDTTQAHNFAQCWHKKWLAGVAQLGRTRDQPALNSALHETASRVHVLPTEYNAQFRTNPAVAKDAIVWHYYYSASQPSYTGFERLVHEVVRTGKVPTRRIAQLCNLEYPWRHDYWFDDFVIRRVRKTGPIQPFDQQWLSGRRMRAVFVSLQGKIKKVTAHVVGAARGRNDTA